MSIALPYSSRFDAIQRRLGAFDQIEAQLRSIRVTLGIIVRNQEKIMASNQDLQTALSHLEAGVQQTLQFVSGPGLDAMRQAWEADDEQQFQDATRRIENAASGLIQGIANAKASASAPGMGPVVNTGLPNTDHMNPGSSTVSTGAGASAGSSVPTAPASTAPADTSTGSAPTTATQPPSDPGAPAVNQTQTDPNSGQPSSDLNAPHNP